MSHVKLSLVAVFSLALGVAVSALAVAQESPDTALGARNPQAKAAFDAGVELLQQQNWNEAIAAFSQAISIDDTFPEAFLGRAEALRELEDYGTALQSYQQAHLFLQVEEPSPKKASFYNGRGVCYRELGQTDLALNDFKNAADMDRNNPEIAANYGDLLVQMGNPVGALRYLDKAIELDPQNAEAYSNRGLAHARMREFEEAIENLRRSVELDPTKHETYSTLASVHTAEQEFGSAIEAFSQAIEHYQPEQSSDPKIFIQGYLSRGNARLRLALDEETTPELRETLYEAMIADTDRVLTEFPDRYPDSGIALYQRGIAMRLQGRLNQAIKSFTDAIQLVPAGSDSQYLADAYLKRGICWHYQEQDSLARGDFQQAASINFSDPLPHLWIGYTYAQEEDYRSAIESYGEAIAKGPTFPTPYVNRGLAYMQLGGFQKAVDNFNEAIRNEPSEPEHFFKRGVAHMQMKEYQKAFDSFHLATLNDATMAKAFRGASDALKALGQDSLAEQYENRAKALDGEGL